MNHDPSSQPPYDPDAEIRRYRAQEGRERVPGDERSPSELVEEELQELRRQGKQERFDDPEE